MQCFSVTSRLIELLSCVNARPGQYMVVADTKGWGAFVVDVTRDQGIPTEQTGRFCWINTETDTVLVGPDSFNSADIEHVFLQIVPLFAESYMKITDVRPSNLIDEQDEGNRG